MKKNYKLKFSESRWGPRLPIKATVNYMLLLLFCCAFIQTSFGQTSLQEMRGYIEEVATTNNVTLNDIAELRITDQNVSTKSQIENIYFCQQYKGIDIDGSSMSIHLTKNKEVVKLNHSFVKDLRGRINASTPRIRADEAIKSAATALKLNIRKPIHVIKPESGADLRAEYSDGGISNRNINTKLIFINSEGAITLAWDFTIYELDNLNWWNVKVDATTGVILHKNNLMLQCSYGHHDHQDDECTTASHSTPATKSSPAKTISTTAAVGGYNVFPFPIENPEDGVRSIVNDPDDPIASPFGWHDTDGVAGAEFTDTRGNNVDVVEDGNNVGFRPDGGATLNFDFPLDLTDPDNSEAADLTNAFYWCNLNHDVLYLYGFDEASGNFQENNYGNGGSGSDFVNADAQKSVFCNASFGTPADGSNPTMNIFICDNGPGLQDGCLNNTTVTHEYIHGLTGRLLGGPSNVSCVFNSETMREGWSDWYALTFTIEPTDTRFDDRYYGNWYYDNPNGIRPHPYSLDMTVNDHTYGSIASLGTVHARGSVFAIMLWEMTWDLIDTYGFDPDIHYGSGGNNIALEIVTEALKLTPCAPGFVDARDGILAADQALYGGANYCLIWNAFARRGLGESADQGSASSSTDGTEAFDIPVACDCDTDLIINGTIASNLYEASSTINSNGTVGPSSNVTFKAGVQVKLNPGFQALEGCDFHAYIAPCNLFAPDDDPNYARLDDYDPTTIFTEEELPKEHKGQINIENYPNPFAERTTFKIDLENESQVILSIYDLAGKLIATPINNTTMSSGTHLIEFENKNLSNGIYYYELSSENAVVTKKMILNK